MTEIIVDAADHILGRLTTQITERAMKGHTVHVINCEDVVLTGDKDKIIQDYRDKRDRGAPYTGPHFPSTPKGIVKRTMRGMVPHEKHRGIQALKRIKCHNTVPHEVEATNAETFDDAKITRTTAKYVTMKEITENL
jgi:large subunit ribosomal protein L13